MIKHKFSLFKYFLVILCSLFAQPGFSESENETLHFVNNQININFQELYQNYGELYGSSDGYLDREYGFIPGIGLTATRTFDKIYSRVNIEMYKGNLSYDGHLLDGHLTPAMAISQYFILNTDIRGGYVFSPSSSINFIPYVTAGYHRWDRDINFHEIYSNFFVGLGATLQKALTDKLITFVDVTSGTILNGQMYAFLGSFNLGKRLFFDTSAGIDYRLAQTFHLTAKIKYNYFGYGMSETNLLGFFEPESHTRRTIASIGFSYHFW